MAKRDSLFSLIKSLSKSEKRYFSLLIPKQQPPNNYKQLFDVLDQMEDYDEARLRSQLQGSVFLDQLHVTKNYLRKLILKSLRNFYNGDSSDLRLHAALQDIEILFKKDLYELCLKSIHSAEQLARRYDNHLAILEILGWKRRVQLLRKGSFHSRDEINQILTMEKSALKELHQLNEYWTLTINFPDRFGTEDLNNIKDHPYFKDESHATSYRSKILHYHLQYARNTIIGQPQKSEEALDKLVGYLESQEWHLREDPTTYVTALTNKIGMYLNLKRMNDIPAVLHKIKAIPKKYGLKNKDKTTMKLWLRTYNVELEIYRDTGDYETGVALIPKVQLFLDQYYDHIPMEYYVLFSYQFAYLRFMSGAYGKALQDINNILVQRYSGVRDDIVGYAQFLNLIIHYELGNTTVLRYAVASSRRFLKKRGKIQDFEKVLLNFFSKVSTKPSSTHRALFQTLEKKLLGPPALLNDNQLDYLDFKSWLNSKNVVNNI